MVESCNKLLYKFSSNIFVPYDFLYKTTTLDNVMNKFLFNNRVSKTDLRNHINGFATEHRYRIHYYPGKFRKLGGVKIFDTLGSRFFFNTRERLYDNIVAAVCHKVFIAGGRSTDLSIETKKTMLKSIKIVEKFGYDPRFFGYLFLSLPRWEDMWYFDKMNNILYKDAFDRNTALLYSKMYGVFRKYIISRRRKIHDTFHRDVLGYCLGMLFEFFASPFSKFVSRVRSALIMRGYKSALENSLRRVVELEFPTQKIYFTLNLKIEHSSERMVDAKFVFIDKDEEQGRDGRNSNVYVEISHHILGVDRKVVVCLLAICFLLSMTKSPEYDDMMVSNATWMNIRLGLTRVLVFLKNEAGIDVKDFLGALHILIKWNTEIDYKTKNYMKRFELFLCRNSRENGFDIEKYLDCLETAEGKYYYWKG